MQNQTYHELFEFIGAHIIQPFYALRLKRLDELKPNSVFKRKNPYLFKAKNITTAQDLVTEILRAHLSPQEETLFGRYLEELAVFISAKEYGGLKSSAAGIDLELEKDGKRYIVTIKSGPHWANSGQIADMKANFLRAKRVLYQSAGVTDVVAVNGCCYGNDSRPNKGDYLKLCGKALWYFIPGYDDLYPQIVEPLGKEAKQKDEVFRDVYSKKANLLTAQFLKEYCSEGSIDWYKLLKSVSGR